MSDPTHFTSQQGFVAFFDLLGFGFLTQAARPQDLASLDLDWIEGAPTDGEERRYALSLVLMISLRRALKSIREFDNSSIDVAQLSDGAFIWSRSPTEFFEAVTELARDLDSAGIMWRAGASRGSIWLPSLHDSDLGKFLAGAAVTRSVYLESRLKGARICVDASLREDFLASGLADVQAADLMFATTDTQEALEYRWYLAPWRNGPAIGEDFFSRGSHQRIEDLAAERSIRRIARLATSREYDWNSLNAEGLQQRVATIVSTANAITSAKGLSLRIEDPAEVRRVLLLHPKPAHAHAVLQQQLALELQRLELGKSLVQSEGLKWPGRYLG